MTPSWSVIICSIDAGRYAHVSQCYQRLLAKRPFEIIGIHDALSLAEGYNRGIAEASGDIVVFSHDDVLIVDPEFTDKIERYLHTGSFHLLGFAGTTCLTDGYWWAAGVESMRGAVAHAPPKHRYLSLCVYGVAESPVSEVQALDGLCLIASRTMVETLRFDADTFDGFHLYDVDYSWSAHLLGLPVGVVTNIPIIHYSEGQFGHAWHTYRRRFVSKHATTLGLTCIHPLPQPNKMHCREAVFQDIPALLEVWQPTLLQRASLALRRETQQRETQQDEPPFTPTVS